MKSIPQYHFHKTKYGEELLIDVVRLKEIKKYIKIDPVHTLTYFDITLIEEGSGSFYIDDRRYEVSPGDMIFSMPGEVREWDGEQIVNGYALIFEEEFLLSFFNDPLFLQNLSFFNPQRCFDKINILSIKKRVDRLIQDIILEINQYESKDKHLLRAFLYEILLLLDREYKKQNGLSENVEQTVNRHANSFISLVNKNFRTNHTTHYYADALCITPNYLNEVIKKTMGVSCKAYIRNRLLSEAKRLLLYTSCSILEVSEELGFDTVSYFIRFFRVQTNYTPLQYRQIAKR